MRSTLPSCSAYGADALRLNESSYVSGGVLSPSNGLTSCAGVVVAWESFDTLYGL